MLVEHHHLKQHKQMYPEISTLQEYIHAYCTILFLLKIPFQGFLRMIIQLVFNSPKIDICVTDIELFKSWNDAYLELNSLVL